MRAVEADMGWCPDTGVVTVINQCLYFVVLLARIRKTTQ